MKSLSCLLALILGLVLATEASAQFGGFSQRSRTVVRQRGFGGGVSFGASFGVGFGNSFGFRQRSFGIQRSRAIYAPAVVQTFAAPIYQAAPVQTFVPLAAPAFDHCVPGAFAPAFPAYGGTQFQFRSRAIYR